ncbi:MAG: hypothetical protein N2Z22_00505, partial [Turneriella sp.]|nr:hypothetical protein [Turneriella sp.]
GYTAKIGLENELSHRALPAHGLFKVRVGYSDKIEFLEIEPYTRHKVEQVALVEVPELDYRYKYADRSRLDALRQKVAPGVQPIIVIGGKLTDALYANICLFDGRRWITPDTPLLHGTARAAAIASGIVAAAPVLAEHFRQGHYTRIKLINCMAHFAEAEEIALG